MPRWIVYSVLAIWIAGALFDLLIASLRVLYNTRGYGWAIRPTRSYVLSGIGSLFAHGALAWLFYSNYTGDWFTIITGTLLGIPAAGYTFWLARSLSDSPHGNDTQTLDSLPDK